VQKKYDSSAIEKLSEGLRLFRPEARHDDDQPAAGASVAGFQAVGGIDTVRHHLGAARGACEVIVGVWHSPSLASGP